MCMLSVYVFLVLFFSFTFTCGNRPDEGHLNVKEDCSYRFVNSVKTALKLICGLPGSM